MSIIYHVPMKSNSLPPHYKITFSGGKCKIAINYDFIKMFTFADLMRTPARAIMEGTQTAVEKSKPIAAENTNGKDGEKLHEVQT